MKPVRCAIYTRKSSEEGLEQAFNSLDAQREACGAYILSQASEGWVALSDIYDDGGLSGGSLERPALQRLLGEVAAGRVDIIVVYKVDRLTRSLLDFSKLVEAFDQAGTSFVSVTQSFNTTTSMGRLTLNMLLSFAQFEREVTAERIRDKIAASKAKGMWMGGTPPLGYKPNGRTLTIIEDHAAIVRHIFTRYLELGNVRFLAADLIEHGITAPQRETATGVKLGGRSLSRGQLYLLLKNPIYVGRVPHREKSYEGLHDAIIEQDVWDRAQALLAEHRQGQRNGRSHDQPSPLAGLVFDEAGQPLMATHACKGKVRYRYYVSRDLQRAETKVGWRIPAGELEAAVAQAVGGAVGDPLGLATRLGVTLSPNEMVLADRLCSDTVLRLSKRGRRSFEGLVAKVTVAAQAVVITLDANAVSDLLGVETEAAHPALIITLPVRLTRTGRVLRLVQPGGSALAAVPPNSSVVRLLAQARDWNARLRQEGADITSVAAEVGRTKSYVSRVVRLAYLAPEVVTALMQGRQRAELGSDMLTLPDAVPSSWREQRQMFLPASRPSDHTALAR